MITLTIAGMTCEGCAKAVRNAIVSHDPAAVVQVDRAAGVLSADTTLTANETIAAVEAAGYEASLTPGG